MAEPKFTFGREFQTGILALMCSNYQFLVASTEIIKPGYFEDNVLIWFYKRIRDYYLDYKKTPTKDVIWNELLKDTSKGLIKEEDTGLYVGVFKDLHKTVDAEEYVSKEVINFCKRQELKKTILDIASYIEFAEEEKFTEIEQRIKTACNIGANTQDLGFQYFMDYQERLNKIENGEGTLVVPTGITEVDYRIKGGLAYGQLGILVGGTGGGKSIGLAHFGKRAVIGGLKVIHFTLELSKEIIASRYDSAFTKISNAVIEDHCKEVDTKLAALASKYGNSLIIKYYPRGTATVETLKAFVTNITATYWKPDLIIVDYGDLLKPLTNYNDEYADLGGIFSDLSGMAGIHKCAVWTASQTNRAGIDAEVVDLTHMADSLKKCFPADIIFGICRNRDEKNENKARLYFQKNRNGPEGIEIPFCTDYETMRFYDPVATAKLMDEISQGKLTKPIKQTKIKAKYYV